MKDKLQIHKLIYLGKDAEEEIKDYVVGDRVLCIPRVDYLRSLYRESPLAIIYSYNGFYQVYLKPQLQQTVLVYNNPVLERERQWKVAFLYLIES